MNAPATKLAARNAGHVADTRKRVDLETLVIWAIKIQRADRDDVALFDVERDLDPLESHRPGISADGVATMLRRGHVGCRVDGSGPVIGAPPRLHQDAETVRAAIDRIPDMRRRSLVLHYGRAGYRPDFETGYQRLVAELVPETSRAARRNRVDGEWEPALERSQIARAMVAAGHSLFDQHGRRRLEVEERGFTFRRDADGKREVMVRWCPVVAEPSLAEIRAVNETYAAWHAGMMRLLGELMGAGFCEHRLTGFSAPACPWA